MTRTSVWRLVALFFALTLQVADAEPPPAARMEPISVRDADEVLQGAVWLPPGESSAATNADSRLPLVVMSHGGGGSFDGHEDTAEALAQAGFVVAAVSHAGDTVGDESRVLELWRRPRQLHRLVDYMLREWRGHQRIDPARIGAFGFSNGGFTVLVAAGGVPRLSAIAPYCESHPAHDLCRALQQAGVDPASIAEPPASAWTADRRIKAVVATAPAFGFAFDRAGLQQVDVPVQLWGGADDRHQPAPFYEDAVRDALPRKPEFRRVEGAGHYAFLPPCPTALAARLPALCTDRPGFDRAAFHRRFNRAVVAFFQAALQENEKKE